MLLSEYTAVATVDEDAENPIVPVSKPFPITKKMGEDKGVMANPDIDQQFATKIYGLQLKLDADKKATFDPSTFINMTGKVLNAGGSSSAMADWNFVGRIE